MTIETEVYTLPSHWAVALINDDWSGYEEAEIEQINRTLEWISENHNGQPVRCIGDEGEVGFTNLHDAWRFGVLACEATDFVFDVTDRRPKPEPKEQIDYSVHRTTWEAQYYVDGVYTRLETISKADAVSLIEEIGGGTLICWHIDRNYPGAKPDFVHKSCSLDVYEDGAWRSVNIFGF